MRGREAILERADGIRIPIVPYPTPFLDDVGAVVGSVNMTVDITERKRAELELSERNAQLALAGRYELGGTVDHDFAPEGVRCTLSIPMEWLSVGESDSLNEGASSRQRHTGRRAALLP
jgi:PAS domain-containing protein